MSAPILKKCRGLYTATNRYDVPEGALVTATNVLINRDGVIQPRWGLAVNGTTLVSGNISHWHRSLELDGYLYLVGRNTATEAFWPARADIPFTTLSVFANARAEPDSALFTSATTLPYYDVEMFKIRGNLYINWFDGLRRYKGTTETKANNLRCAVSCFPRPISVSSASRASNVATVTTAFAHGYATGITVTTTGADGAADKVITVTTSTAFTYANVGADGALTITAATAHQIVGASGFMAADDRVAYRAFLTEYDSSGNAYVGEVCSRVVVTNGTPFVGAAATKNVQLAVLIDTYATTSQIKLEVYRSATAASAEPNDQMALVYTKYLTGDEMNNGFVWITDITPNLQLGKALYTNEDQEGLKQNNLIPAGCKTAAVWGKRVVQANTFDFPSIEMQLLSTVAASGGLAAGDVFRIDGDISTTVGEYLAVASASPLTAVTQFSIFTGGTATTDVKNTVLSLIDNINWVSGSIVGNDPIGTYAAEYLSLGTDWPGRFRVFRTAADQYEASSTTVKKRPIVTKGTGASTRGAFAPKLGVVKSITGASRTSNVVTVTCSSAHNIVAGDHVSLYNTWANQTVVASGIATTATTTTDVVFAHTGSNGAITSDAVALTYNPLMQGFHVDNKLRVSKVSPLTGTHPEAFPEQNTITVGAPGFKILKCVACKDSLLVFKEDGLFRVTATGVFGEELHAELLDPNAILWAKDSAVAIQGKVMAWLTKGVAIINEQGVEKYVSERIADKLSPTTTATAAPQLLAYPFSRRAQAFVDEVNGLYELRVSLASAAPDAPYASTVNVIYDMLNDTWVEDDLAVVSEAFYNGKRYIVQGTSLYTQVDAPYSDTGTAAVSVAVATSTSGVYSFTYTGSLTPGDLLIGTASQATAYCLTADGGVGTMYDPTGYAPLEGTGWTNSYRRLVCTVQWAPFTFGAENKLKRFTELQLLFGVKENYVAEVVFSTELVTTVETLTCKLGTPQFTAGVNAFAPYNLRVSVPQQHRLAQQLSVKLVIRTALLPWTIIGIGADAKVQGTRINR